MTTGRGARTLSEILDRFRRPAGVPVAAAVEPDSELLDLFAVLDDLEREAVALREASAATIANGRTEAEAEIDRVLAQTRREAEAEAEEIRARRLQRAAAERDAAVEAAAVEAARMADSARLRMPALVGRVVESVVERPA